MQSSLGFVCNRLNRLIESDNCQEGGTKRKKETESMFSLSNALKWPLESLLISLTAANLVGDSTSNFKATVWNVT